MVKAVKDKECYSCGKEADANSPRGFCSECDAHFEEGEKRQEYVYTRAYLLEEAKFNKDKDRVGEIMNDIFSDIVVLDSPAAPTEPVNSATARKVEG